jgi:hypothetical protein
MPFADTVKREIHGNSPADTIARQVAALTVLESGSSSACGSIPVGAPI